MRKARVRSWVTSPSYKTAVAMLVAARKASGMTQRALAEAVGKGDQWSFIAKIEQGERRVDVVEFIVIARALGLKEVDLFRELAEKLSKRIDI